MNEETPLVHTDTEGEQGPTRAAAETSQRYALYHANTIWAMVEPRPDDWTENRALHYTHVADIEAPRQSVFSLSNHYEGRDWTQNPEVLWYNTSVPIRSTSVGDVIVSSQTGQAWLVMAAFLQEISSSAGRSLFQEQ